MRGIVHDSTSKGGVLGRRVLVTGAAALLERRIAGEAVLEVR
jgi:hypothetical protein